MFNDSARSSFVRFQSEPTLRSVRPFVATLLYDSEVWILYSSGSQTFSVRVPFVILSPHHTYSRKTHLPNIIRSKFWENRIGTNSTRTKWMWEIIMAIFKNQEVPYLFDCRPRLMCFSSFVRLIFFFFSLSKGLDRWRSMFHWLRFVDRFLFAFFLLFTITCTLRHRMDYDEQKAVVVV